MTFSIGQNFFNDLLESSDKTTHNDQKAIEQTYLLQKRLNDFWVNNDIPVLLKSKEFGGMVDLLGNAEPSGGHINWQRCGARNAPGSCKYGCPDEYAFWGTPKENKPQDKKQDKKQDKPHKKENFENINNKVIEQPEIIERFTVDDVIGHKENFSGTTTILCIVLIVVLVLGIGGFLFFIRNKNRLP